MSSSPHVPGHIRSPDEADALSPNTSAFISYLASGMDAEERAGKNPTSFPPSAFFPMPIPGRDTPEDTPPSSIEQSQSPEKGVERGFSFSVSDDSEPDGQSDKRRLSGQGIHKRKAGGDTRQDDEEEDDDESESEEGHEGKRAHGKNAIGSGRKGGRKSGTNEDGQGKGRDVGKAARRKEQNRAAQKAFRERRETKVKDLEEKVAELESKSYGTAVENENLRGILKRLQEENVALKQSAFTFSVPLSGSGTPANAMTSQQAGRAPSPPDERLRSIDEVPALLQPDSSEIDISPDSLVSVSSDDMSRNDGHGSAKLFDTDAFNAYALGRGPLGSEGPAGPVNKDDSPISSSRMNISSSPSSSTNGNKSDIDALFASFYPDGIDAVIFNAQKQVADKGGQPRSQQSAPNFTNELGSFPAQQSFGVSGNSSGRDVFNPMAYRDTMSAPVSAPAAAAPSAQDAWADLTDNSVSDFLASLTGSNTDNADPSAVDDDFFNAQLQQILQQNGSGNSPSAAFALPQNGPSFSPTNYLNMSPSPLNSISSNQSPDSQQTASSSASPESSGLGSCMSSDMYGDGVATFGPPKAASDLVYVVDDEGKVIKPSELWVKMGLHHEDNVDHLLIDDLCDQMRAKATCKDGSHYLSARDAQDMIRFRSIGEIQDDGKKTGKDGAVQRVGQKYDWSAMNPR